MIDLREGDCLKILPALADASVDAVVTDPPYPEIDRAYGRWTEKQWWELIVDGVIPQVRRILKPNGSAVFILQPNSRKVGSMRGWLWEFMAWCCREWNMVQDAYWWNFTAPPTVHTYRTIGLMRPSLKECVWLGASDCYRNQDAVLWEQSEANAAVNREDRLLRRNPSGQSMRSGRCAAAADERGGVTPFNVIPIANTNSTDSAGAEGHGAGTPMDLCRWWTRYICPPGGTVLDPFAGSGTLGIAAHLEDRNAILIEREPGYCDIIRKRIATETERMALFARIEPLTPPERILFDEVTP